MSTLRSPAVVSLAALLLASAGALFGQATATARFASASIKPTTQGNDPGQHPAMGVGYKPGGRLTATDASLKLLVQFAYADHDAPHWIPMLGSRVVGGPEWMDGPRYDIDAKPVGNADSTQSWLMLQTLLADRFKLTFHRETQEMTVYELTAAKGGPKLSPAATAVCVSFPPGTPPQPVSGKVDCGYVSGPMVGYTPGLLRIQGRKIHVSDLVRELGAVLDRPVSDKTEFPGEFDLDLSFTPSEATLGIPATSAVADAGLPNLFAAMADQLGLTLVAAKGPVEVMVIDRAEKPTAN